MLRGKDTNNDSDNEKPKREGNNSKRRRSVDAGGHGGTSNNNMHQPTSSTTSSTKDLLRELPEDFEPGEYDVVCSRGKWAMNSPGNVRYRSVIKDNLQRYSAVTSKQEKSAIVSEIVDAIQELSPQGGFVRQVNGKWYTVTDHIAREKTGQSFRDLLHTQYKSSTKAKRRRQKERDLKECQSMMAAAAATASQGQRSAFQQATSGGGAGRGSAPASNVLPAHAFTLGDAANQVFPNIPNHNNSMMRNQLPHHHPPPLTPQRAGPGFTASDMAMAQHQQHLQHQPFPYDLNQLNHNQLTFPIHNNASLPHVAVPGLPSPHQEQRIAVGDLEPIPIREASMPTSLMLQQQAQAQALQGMQQAMGAGTDHPHHLQVSGPMHPQHLMLPSLPLQQQQHALAHPNQMLQHANPSLHHQQQHQQPYQNPQQTTTTTTTSHSQAYVQATLRHQRLDPPRERLDPPQQQLEPIPLHEASDPDAALFGSEGSSTTIRSSSTRAGKRGRGHLDGSNHALGPDHSFASDDQGFDDTDNDHGHKEDDG